MILLSEVGTSHGGWSITAISAKRGVHFQVVCEFSVHFPAGRGEGKREREGGRERRRGEREGE